MHSILCGLAQIPLGSVDCSLGHLVRVPATAQHAWIADTIQRLLRDMDHRAPARTARQLRETAFSPRRWR
jgi:hypothetical protein